MITALIIDDEIEAREGLAFLLEQEVDFKVIGSCKDGIEAEKAIKDLTPDLVFLDVQMPGKNGFDVLETLSPAELPLVVFITAYDEYALEAFRVHALDYLQKPFTNQRFKECLNHVRLQFQPKSSRSFEGLRTFLQQIKERPEVEQRKEQLKIRSSGKIYFLDTNDIAWIEGFDYYIKVHTASRFYLVRESLIGMQEKLPPEFIRIHKSAIINKGFLHSMEPRSRGNYQVELKNGKQLVMSKHYKGNLDLF